MDSYFEQQVTLAAFADVTESALDELPIIWVTTPAREMGYTLAERIMQRIAKEDSLARSQTLKARLIAKK